MGVAETTRRNFVKTAALGAAAASLNFAGIAGAEEAAGSASANADLPDTYTSASLPMFKSILEGEDVEKALQFLADSSHYLYIDRATPYHGNYTLFPETGFDTEWRSPLNGRPYRGPYYDPMSRSVIWLAASQNGAINASVGSYWACIPPNTELDLKYNELQDYAPSEDWQIVSYMYNGQTAQNLIRNGRGTLMIDAALAGNYGIEPGWGYAATGLPHSFDDRGVLGVEVKLNHYAHRTVTAQQYYDGYLPTTINMCVPSVWGVLPGWTADAGEDQYRTPAQFWGCAEGADAELNLTTDEEREAYIERADADPAVGEALSNQCVDLYFDIMQIVNVKQQIGFDFEQASGKINGIDMDGDGLIDRYPEGHEKAGELIIQNAYGFDNAHLLPDWAYELNYNLDWWVVSEDVLVNSEGKKLVGANPDGTYILEGEE